MDKHKIKDLIRELRYVAVRLDAGDHDGAGAHDHSVGEKIRSLGPEGLRSFSTLLSRYL